MKDNVYLVPYTVSWKTTCTLSHIQCPERQRVPGPIYGVLKDNVYLVPYRVSYIDESDQDQNCSWKPTCTLSHTRSHEKQRVPWPYTVSWKTTCTLSHIWCQLQFITIHLTWRKNWHLVTLRVWFEPSREKTNIVDSAKSIDQDQPKNTAQANPDVHFSPYVDLMFQK